MVKAPAPQDRQHITEWMWGQMVDHLSCASAGFSSLRAEEAGLDDRTRTKQNDN